MIASRVEIEPFYHYSLPIHPPKHTWGVGSNPDIFWWFLGHLTTPDSTCRSTILYIHHYRLTISQIQYMIIYIYVYLFICRRHIYIYNYIIIIIYIYTIYVLYTYIYIYIYMYISTMYSIPKQKSLGNTTPARPGPAVGYGSVDPWRCHSVC